MPPMECINHGTCHVPFILTLTIRQTTTAPNHSLHQHQSVHPPAVSACTHEVQALASTACSINYKAPQHIHLPLQGKFLHLPCRLPSIFCIICSWCNSFFSFQMAVLNFECIFMMLKDGGTIP